MAGICFRSSSSSNPNPTIISNPTFSSSSSRATTLPGFRLRPAVCSLKVAGGAVRRNPIGCLLNRSGDAWLNPIGSNFRPMLLPSPPRCGSVFAESDYPGCDFQHWVVSIDRGDTTVAEIDRCYQTLAKVLGSEEEARKKIYDVSFEFHIEFSCKVDEETALKLLGMPGVLSVIPDAYVDEEEDEELAPGCDFKHWVALIENPKNKGATKQQMLDCCVETLAKVLGSEEEAKKKIYSIHFERFFGFGCEIDEETAMKLEALRCVGVVLLDKYDVVEYKDYGGELCVNGKIVQRSPERQMMVDKAFEDLDGLDDLDDLDDLKFEQNS